MRAIRAIVLALAVAGFVAAAALLVREVALQAAGTLVWTTPRWWSPADHSGGWGATGIAGVALLLLAAVLFALAVRVVLPRGSQEAHVQIGSPGSRASVRRTALEEMIGGALGEELLGVSDVRVRVTRREQRLVTRTRLAAPGSDLAGLHKRTLTIVRREIAGATGLETERLVLEVDRLSVAEGGAS